MLQMFFRCHFPQRGFLSEKSWGRKGVIAMGGNPHLPHAHYPGEKRRRPALRPANRTANAELNDATPLELLERNVPFQPEPVGNQRGTRASH